MSASLRVHDQIFNETIAKYQGHVFSTAGTRHFVVLAAAALVFVSAGLVTIAERSAKGANIHDFARGSWWAITTVTTVGYGDRYPTTPFGQGVAVFLMWLASG